MKTIEELYNEIRGNEELKKAFSLALKENRIEEFAKAHGCEATAADAMAFLKGLKSRELSEDDMEKVAGGKACSSWSCECTEHWEFCDLHKQKDIPAPNPIKINN